MNKKRDWVEETRQILLNPATEVFIEDAISHLQEIIRNAKCAIADIETAVKMLQERIEKSKEK